jgi:small subunit ribosomal protein S20
MANTKSAKKAARQNPKRYQKNLSRKTAIKTAVKKVLDAVELKSADMAVLLRDAEAKLARAKSKGLIDANTASRKVSRLAKKVAQASR